MTVTKHITSGFHTVAPYLNIKGASKAIDFYKKVFGAKEIMRMLMPDGKIMHAQIAVGDSMIMLADECDMMNNKSPETLHGTPVSFYLFVPDADETYNLALREGSTIYRVIEDRFYGDRVGVITDPFGHIWSIATHVKDVAADEMQQYVAKLFSQ